MAEYRIEKVSTQEPRKYHNEKFNSDTFYIRVKLEGHTKPVEIGKKTPDALRDGMTVTGTILDKPDFDADGFKADSPAYGGGGGYSKGGGSGYTPRDDSAIKAQWAIGQALQSIANRPDSEKSIFIDYDKVQEVANRLFAMVEEVKQGSSESTNPKVTPTTSNPARVNTKDPDAKLWPSDLKDSDPDFDSMLRAGLQADEINLDEIPF